ncbi:hypothetical protein Tco_1568973 [Tanacetum coccineum]
MILESVEHGPLIWPTVEENGVIRTKKYAELSAAEKIQADCDMKATIVFCVWDRRIVIIDEHHITMQEYIRLEEEKARRRGKVYNWETATYDFEKEFLAIVYNDALTSKLDFLTEPTVSPQHIDEFNLTDETSLSEYKDNNDDKIDIKQSSGGSVINPDDGAYAHG